MVSEAMAPRTERGRGTLDGVTGQGMTAHGPIDRTTDRADRMTDRTGDRSGWALGRTDPLSERRT
ncbi:hypothetical protein GCM10023195_72660 [Actinoallomurus liliacearum]|uniref:Uncharacterized protein n=1 Tax=Actinoallomurus liliacearum TaxID=1080073 RepID=A0ABP8TU01_9ACTN